jgi:hypothetical protein
VTHFDESCDPVKLMERNVSCLLYADDLVLILESAISTALVEIPEVLKIIPKYVYSISKINSVIIIQKTFSGQLSASFT